MPPYVGLRHRRPRADSGAVRIWRWARRQRGTWTVSDAADAVTVAPRTARKAIAALGEAGLLDQVDQPGQDAGGIFRAAQWRISARGRAARGVPILTVDGATGRITGVRLVAATGAG